MGSSSASTISAICCKCNEMAAHPERFDSIEFALAKPEISNIGNGAAHNHNEEPMVIEGGYQNLVLSLPGPALAFPAQSQQPDPVVVPAEPCDFSVSLDRISGDRLGIDIDQQDGHWLLVHRIDDGIIKEWNRSHPLRVVKEGSCIIQVNGIRGNVPLMIQECQTQGILDLIVRPPLRERDPMTRGLCVCKESLLGLLWNVNGPVRRLALPAPAVSGAVTMSAPAALTSPPHSGLL
mmetsp:Transcript_31868/g.62737  ORF Transcript_31868/g.62737 Transcript_31868/m.62737 type:complete len:236 (-) Transcript_31868:174-881(-)|eukprot:CAMPEP_0172697870 /NCGR_PEP_ID=MMETSP1074-20121228/29048_1 /TAXON_ID=2916 /ORGANISM="Ceratium fusus, Strain PA161109" /LENGTH=235 /DNA_ID=CAMNT_0013518823 /DNA_START=88 /DNA_END=795 /DNA_ORIENTATION=+